MIKTIFMVVVLLCLETLGLLLNQYCPEVQVMGQCQSAKIGLEAIRQYKPDLVFLDIEMPVMNGFELLEQLSTLSFAIIFTTSYDQYAIKAIRLSALDYLLKPVNPKELVAAIKKVHTARQLPAVEQFEMLLKKINDSNTGFNKIAVPTAEGFELIPADQVIYCEANDNYTHFYLVDKNKIIACRTLKEIEEQLSDFPFFIRVHNSYLVNLNEVKKYVRGEGGHLIMSDASTINVSRSRKDALLKRF